MLNLGNHKGSFCVCSSIFCQEGYCSGCDIYLKKSSPAKLVDRCVDATLKEVTQKSQTYVCLEQAN